MADGDATAMLSQLFPDIERDILAALLEHHGSAERVALELLDETFDDVTPDDADDGVVARNMQEGIDAEMAAALQRELDQEQRPAAPGQAHPGQAGAGQAATAVAASAAAERVALGAKRLLQRVRQMSAKNRGTHGQRLLDDSATTSDVNEPIQAPLSPLYSPPVPPPPERVAPTDYAAVSPPTPPLVAPLMMTPPPTSSTRAVADDSEAVSRDRSASPPSKPTQYNSRLERARQANRTMSRSTGQHQPLISSLAPASPAISSQPVGPIEVPVGELI